VAANDNWKACALWLRLVTVRGESICERTEGIGQVISIIPTRSESENVPPDVRFRALLHPAEMLRRGIGTSRPVGGFLRRRKG
jgi:hypothetical protein